MVEMTEEELDPLPAMYQHCVDVYQAMTEHSFLTQPEEGSPMVVYEGMLTTLIRTLRFSVPYYTKIRAELMRMGCIKQLKRGGGNAPSQWLLIRTPTEELWRNAATKKKQGTTPLEQQLKDLGNRIRVLEEQVQVLVGAVTNE